VHVLENCLFIRKAVPPAVGKRASLVSKKKLGHSSNDASSLSYAVYFRKLKEQVQ